jgi:hypothetical protein
MLLRRTFYAYRDAVQRMLFIRKRKKLLEEKEKDFEMAIQTRKDEWEGWKETREKKFQLHYILFRRKLLETMSDLSKFENETKKRRKTREEELKEQIRKMEEEGDDQKKENEKKEESVTIGKEEKRKIDGKESKRIYVKARISDGEELTTVDDDIEKIKNKIEIKKLKERENVKKEVDELLYGKTDDENDADISKAIQKFKMKEWMNKQRREIDEKKAAKEKRRKELFLKKENKGFFFFFFFFLKFSFFFC